MVGRIECRDLRIDFKHVLDKNRINTHKIQEQKNTHLHGGHLVYQIYRRFSEFLFSQISQVWNKVVPVFMDTDIILP